MDTQSVLIGQIVLGNEPRISLYAETPVPLSREGIATLKDKLATILDSRFRASDPPCREEMSIAEVAARWHCRAATVLRRIRTGELHPIERNNDVFFRRSEVERLSFTA